MLTVNNLKKIFFTDSGEVHAADGVCFEIQEGEFYTLLGPSGCGKTTTLQCIAGLETPDEGEILMGGNMAFSSRERILVPAHRRDIGMVFQSYAIWPHMTVFENVAFPLAYGRNRLSKRLIKERVMKALNLVKLAELEDRPAPFLSGGQQQRVALARAIVNEPKVLLLDEPLSNLDAKLRDEMRFEIRQLVNQLHITTLYVTHDQVEALSMSDHIGVMRSGRIIQEGTPREIYLAPRDQFVADFLGKSNFIEGRLSAQKPKDGFGLVDTSVGQIQCLITIDAQAGDTVLLAVRPGGILVSRQESNINGNTFQGQIESTVFVGDFLECQIRAGSQLLRAMLDPYEEFNPGEMVFIRMPADRLVTVAKLSYE
jgi:iron(III) transport system ATP-binding protein